MTTVAVTSKKKLPALTDIQLQDFLSNLITTAGLSAYDVAVANGFSGNEAAWLASLVGANGADGATGPAGADSTVPGPTGPAGPGSSGNDLVQVSDGSGGFSGIGGATDPSLILTRSDGSFVTLNFDRGVLISII